MCFIRLCLLVLRQLSFIISFIQTYKSEQFSQNFDRLAHSFSGDNIYILDKKILHFYSVFWTAESKFNSKIKSISYKNGFASEDTILHLDIFPYDARLIMVTSSMLDKLQVLNLSSKGKEEVERFPNSEYTIDTFSDVVDLFISKDDSLKDMNHQLYLMVQTKTSFLIFTEVNRRLVNLFSLEGRFQDIHKCKFNFYLEHEGEKSILNGMFGVLEKEVFTMYVIGNLENNKQPGATTATSPRSNQNNSSTPIKQVGSQSHRAQGATTS